MRNSFNYEVNKILKQAEKEMLSLNHPYVGTEHLLLSLLRKDKISSMCAKYNLTYNSFRQELIDIVGLSHKKSEVVLYTPLLKIIINNANRIALEEKREMNEFDLFNSLLTGDDGIAIRIIESMNIDVDSLIINDSYCSSVLDEIGTNLNNVTRHPLIGREEVINSLIEILLRKNKNNPVLIGECGVGKSAIVYELARRIKNKDVPSKLKDMKIIMLEMSSMLSNTKYRGEFETRINNIIKEVKRDKNIILFIDEIHTIVKSGGSEGSIDAANILKPYLASDEIKIIGATTVNEYERFIARDKALERRFAKVYVSIPTNEETINILNGVKDEYEKHHGVKITSENIEDIVSLSNKYIHNNNNPDKSLDVLDFVCSRVQLKANDALNNLELKNALEKKDYKKALEIKKEINQSVISINKDDILSVIQSITNITFIDDNVYQDTCNYLDQKVLGIDLSLVKNTLKNLMLDHKCQCLHFKGKPHSGKKYTAKTLAYKLNYNLIEIDGVEYSSSTSITKLIGSNPGYIGYEEESILDRIKYRPFSMILIKNYNAMSTKVANLFNSIITQSSLKNNKGEEINFNNVLIIILDESQKEVIGYNKDTIKEDNVVYFNSIKKELLKEYIKEMNIDYNEVKEETSFNELISLQNKIYN